MRLDKFLTKCGLGSRTETRKIIKAKRVTVYGNIVTNINLKVEDGVAVDGKPLTLKEYVYIMLNKPKGVISAATDREYTTVVDILDGYDHYDLFPVGRLDMDTTGLLIITNDGKLTHRIISPKMDKEKTYLCTLRDPFSSNYVQPIEQGIPLKDFTTKPAKVEKLSDKTCYLTITEGKYHQVKRMFLYLGNEITDLHRVCVNGLKLDNSLQQGEYRELTEEELITLKN